MNRYISPYVMPGLECHSLIDVIAKEFKVDANTVFVKTRRREIIEARQFYIFMVCKIIGKGPSVAGRHIGQGHANMIHACKEVENHIKTEKEYRKRAEKIISMYEDDLIAPPNLSVSLKTSSTPYIETT